MKNLVSIENINKEILTSIYAAAENTLILTKNLSKVLGLLFLNESTRTSASLKSAIIRLGSGWLGIEGIQGSYLSNKIDTVNNTIRSLANYCDIIAIRGDLKENVFNHTQVPIINCGNDFIITPLWGIWLSYLVRKLFGENKIKIGVYGLTGFSSPIKSYYSVLSLQGHSFFEDSIIDEASSSEIMINLIKKNGSTFNKSKLIDFIEDIDLLIVSDCNPEQNISNIIYQKFLKSFEPINSNLLKKLANASKVFIVEPYKFSKGEKSTIDDEALKNSKIINDKFNKLSVQANIGIITWLLSE